MRVLLTGASGLVGGRVLALLLEEHRVEHVVVLVRERRPTPGPSRSRVSYVTGDVRLPAFGVSPRRFRGITHVVHAAADTTFSQRLDEARAVNTRGTAHALQIAERSGARRFVHVSTAYVAGTATGSIPEDAAVPDGFVNAYERSKHEAEQLVRASGLDAVVLRPSTIVCDDARGGASQLNAVHRALRVMHAGLAPMMPGRPETPVDFVTTAYVANAIVRIGLAISSSGTYHLCAGEGALPLGEVLERAFRLWRRDDAWRRRGIEPPVLTDIDTYRDFERAVHETGDARLAAVARSLSHFAPQMALPKHFETTRSARALGRTALPVTAFLDAVVSGLAVARNRSEAA